MLKIFAKMGNIFAKIGMDRSYAVAFLVIFIIGLVFGYFVETMYFYNLSEGTKDFWQILRPI